VKLRIVLLVVKRNSSSGGGRRSWTGRNRFWQDRWPPLHDEPTCATGRLIHEQRVPLAGRGAQLDQVAVAVFVLGQDFNRRTRAIVGVVAYEVAKIGEV
jgi:hypothetical protein